MATTQTSGTAGFTELTYKSLPVAYDQHTITNTKLDIEKYFVRSKNIQMTKAVGAWKTVTPSGWVQFSVGGSAQATTFDISEEDGDLARCISQVNQALDKKGSVLL